MHGPSPVCEPHRMRVYLVDGTYELFRHFFPLPSHINAAGEEVSAARGTVGSILQLLESGATHVGVATDQVIESYRNDLWPGYKDGSGIDPALYSQFPILEAAVEAIGVTLWPMVEVEADDAMASAAAIAAADARVEQVLICTPDKDLAQCVVDDRVVQVDRRRDVTIGVAGVREKYGVDPASIPDWLALTGDSADGFPGLKGWGAKSAAAVLAHYKHLEDIPANGLRWDIDVRSAVKLATTLQQEMEHALLFKHLATLRLDAPVGAVDDWEWRGPSPDLDALCTRLEAPRLAERVNKLAAARGIS
ncbi:MAG: Flap endonuclease [Actinomycetia bacterium]|nr:Flap endonuclease [Actinomycetes bacterium]